MIPLLRLAFFGLIGLTVCYFLVSVYAASLRREALEKEWVAKGSVGDHDAFVAQGMAAYRKSFRRRMIWLVYIIPITIFVVMVYFLNFS